MGRTNFAPTARTIIVALILMLVGLLGTYGSLIPDQLGVLSLTGAVVIMLAGIVFRKI